MDILNNRYITYDKIKAFVEPKGNDLNEFGVNYGDVLFQRSSETLEDVGRANVYLDNKTALFGGFVIRGKKIGKYNPLFFRYLLSSPHVRKRIVVKGAGAQHFNIGQDGLSKISIFVPTTKEQERIAQLLDLIDERIEVQIRIIEKLQSLMKGITNRIVEDLITNTKSVPFSEIYQMAGEGGTPDTTKTQYYAGGTIPFIKIDDLSSKYLTKNKDFITEQGLQKSSAWIIPRNSLIYSNGATIGAVSINTYKVATKQGILGIVPKSIISVEYLYYLVKSTFFDNQVHRIITHGTMATAYLKDINNIKVPLPCMNEQRKIVTGLALLSNKIEIEQRILFYLQKQKEFLLGNLFI